MSTSMREALEKARETKSDGYDKTVTLTFASADDAHAAHQAIRAALSSPAPVAGLTAAKLNELANRLYASRIQSDTIGWKVAHELFELARLTPSPVNEEELAKTFKNADEQDWWYLLSLIPDGGRGRFWKDRLSALRALLSQFSIGRK